MILINNLPKCDMHTKNDYLYLFNKIHSTVNHTSSLSQIKYRDRGLFADISKNDISDKETANEKVYS